MGVESTTGSGGEANATTNNVGFYPRMSYAKNVPTSVEKRFVDIKKVLWHTTPAVWIGNSFIKNGCRN